MKLRNKGSMQSANLQGQEIRRTNWVPFDGHQHAGEDAAHNCHQRNHQRLISEDEKKRNVWVSTIWVSVNTKTTIEG